VLQDRVLFGSDWPVITPQRWLDEFDQLGLPDAVREKILLSNAQRLFGI
jgi:predicted TIM-barrel fold metal-dependent hydrolase